MSEDRETAVQKRFITDSKGKITFTSGKTIELPKKKQPGAKTKPELSGKRHGEGHFASLSGSEPGPLDKLLAETKSKPKRRNQLLALKSALERGLWQASETQRKALEEELAVLEEKDE